MEADDVYDFPVYDALSHLPPGPVSRLRQRPPGARAASGPVVAVRLARGGPLLDGPALLVCSWNPSQAECSREWIARDTANGFTDVLLRTQSADAVLHA